MKPVQLFLIVLLVLAPLSVAQSKDLTDLQATALKSRQVIQRYENNLEKSIKDERIAQSGYYPSVDLAYTVNSLDEAATFEARENSVFTAAVSINLFSGFKDKYSIKSAALLRQVETYKLKGIRQDIMANVALYYLNVYGRKANLKAQQDTHTTLQRVYEDGKKRNEVGLIDNNSLLKFKVDLDYAGIQVKKAQAELDKSLLLLRREAGSQVGLTELSFTEFQAIPHVSHESYEKEMLTNRSEIKVLEEMVGIYEAQAQMAGAAYYPQLGLTTSYKNYDDNYVNGAGDSSEDEIRAQIVLSMNLFNGFASQETIAKAEIDKRSARLDLAELKNDLKTSLASLYLDYEVSRDTIKAALSNIEQAKENLRVTRLKYQEGLQTESELLGAVSTLSRAEYNHVEVITALFSNYYKIVRAAEKFADLR